MSTNLPSPAGTPSPAVVTVPVTSAWASKINWVQVLGPLVSLGTYLLGLLPADYAAYGALATQVIQSIATWYFRTYQTVSVTPSSVANSTTIPQA